jgi:alpha-L-rhamnosidase
MARITFDKTTPASLNQDSSRTWSWDSTGQIHHDVIQPTPGGPLTSAKAELETPYGKASSAWTLKNGTLHIEALVPPNTTATLMLPGKPATRLLPGRHVFATARASVRTSVE